VAALATLWSFASPRARAQEDKTPRTHSVIVQPAAWVPLEQLAIPDEEKNALRAEAAAKSGSPNAMPIVICGIIRNEVVCVVLKR
jgi:hypothetical protein